MTDLYVASIHVIPDTDDPTKGTLYCGDPNNSATPCWPCILGKGGVKDNKREGDGATPTGCYPIRRVLYRADRGDLPETGLSVSTISPSDGWCDEPEDPAYNQAVDLPYAASCESLWREDRLYDIIVILGHNDDPPVASAGSAIFMHQSNPKGTPTLGCIALEPDDLRAVLKLCGPETKFVIRLN